MMAYALWKNGTCDHIATFEVFFRKNPFKGEFTVCQIVIYFSFCQLLAGVSEIISYVDNFHLTTKQIEYLETILNISDPLFFDWLAKINTSRVRLASFPEGSVVFPREPLIRIDGPIAIVQLLETPILTLLNFPSLIATNAARMRRAAGDDKILLEFGLRRAQGPDGGLSASRYAYMGGFDATSHLLAGMLFQIPTRGTQAHSFIQSFTSFHDLRSRTLVSANGVKTIDFVDAALTARAKLPFACAAKDNELTSFLCYAQSFPNGFLCLVDTYDVLVSGVPNFLAVAAALHDAGYCPKGVRIDSGDLAYLSRETRRLAIIAADILKIEALKSITIVASNDIDEDTLLSLGQQQHEITTFGIGTHLVTCSTQPALGAVFKLVELNGIPRIKLSQDVSKVTIPCRKRVFRLFSTHGIALVDILISNDETPPTPGQRFLCHHPFDRFCTFQTLVI